MQLKLLRYIYNDKDTIGALIVNDKFQCYILEPQSFLDYGPKCIPAGRYQIIKNMSPRFNKLMWRLVGMDQEGVLIHTGNSAVDTKGCLLPANDIRDPFFVLNSRLAFAFLDGKLQEAWDKQEEIWLDVLDTNH